MPKPEPPATKVSASSPPAEPQDDLFAASPPLPVAPLDDAQRLACLRLIRSENVGPVTFRQLINHYGGAEQALEALPAIAKRGGRKAIRICPRDTAEAELEAAEKAGAIPVFTIEPGYPKRIALLDVPPPMLYVKGRPELLNMPSLAIVGARQATSAGHRIAHTFAAELGRAGLVIVSGLARGIDGAAHAASLDTGTMAVVAGGVDVIYPPEHQNLHARIAKEGCIISEMPCGFQPRAKDFPRRNRLISAAALGVLVVEAARRSGTLSTARLAAEQGRAVFAVPGHPLDPRAEGTNALLKTGATIATEPDDVLSVLAPMTASAHGTFNEPAPPPLRRASSSNPATSHVSRSAQESRRSPEPECPEDPNASASITPQAQSDVTDEQAQSDLTDEQAQTLVAGQLSPAPVDVDDLVRSTGLPARMVRTALMILDIQGAIERHGANMVSLRTPERPPNAAMRDTD